MKKLLLSLFVIVPMVPVTAAASTPVGALVPLMLVAPRQVDAIPSGALPGTSGTPVLTCDGALDKLIADFQAGKSMGAVNSTLINGALSLAESPHLPVSGGGFVDVGGRAQRSGSTIVGTSHVAAPGGNTSADLGFTIDKANGKARLRWTYGGKSHASYVDSCSSGYWTAASATSAIAIKLGAMQSPPE